MLEIRVRILVQARVRRLATSIGSVESILAGFIRFQFRHKVPYHAFVRVFLGHMFQRNEHFLPYRVEMQKTIDPPLEDLRAGPQKRGLICKDVCIAELILSFQNYAHEVDRVVGCGGASLSGTGTGFEAGDQTILPRIEGKEMTKLITGVWLIFISSGVLVAQNVSGPLTRHYVEGEKLTYHMKGINENWHYEIQADGVVKKGADGSYFEEYGWSNLISDGQKESLSPSAQNLRQQVSLDPNRPPSMPDLSKAPNLIGPITDLMTFYVDVWMAARTGKLKKEGDHAYLKLGTPSSWADGVRVLQGDSSVDFDFTLKEINQKTGTVTLIARHVPPEQTQLKLPAEWMRKPVADTANNWVTVEKTKDGKFLGAVGKEVFDVEIKLSLADGKILTVKMDNPVQTIERECADQALTQCGDPKPHLIRRQIEMELVH